MADSLTVEERLNRVEAEQVTIREEMRTGFARIEARFADMPTRTEMQAAFAQMPTRAEMLAGHQELRATIERVHEESVAANAELREYIDFAIQRQGRETRSYFDIVAEGLRDDVRKIAEGYVATNERIDRLALGQVATNERIDRLALGQVATNDRIDRLAQDHVATNERIDRLEQKMDRGFAEVRSDIAGLVQTLQKRSRRR